jgi:drug/metabolite transporter (DMT)-like permease
MARGDERRGERGRSVAASGLALAFGAAVISGVAVFTNSYGVKAFGDPTVYTTAKNLVAALVLSIGVVLVTRRGSREGFTRPQGRAQWAGLVAVGIVGGSVPFVLFFEGLARATSVQAAFLQKTLVVWVAILAVPFLRERIRPANVAAIALLVWGQAVLGGGIRELALGSGEAMILAATLLWSVEVVIAKRLLGSLSPLTVGTSRMALGAVALIAWTVATTPGSELAAITTGQWSWALLTGLILAGYVATWYSALARARAIDVTSVLVFGAFVTAALQGIVDGVPLGPQAFGLGLVVVGTAVAVLGAMRREPGLEAAA